MTRKEIETKVNTIFADVTYTDIEEIDIHSSIFGQQGLDELDIMDVLLGLDKEFSTALLGNDEIDLYSLTVEGLYDIVEQEINKELKK